MRSVDARTGIEVLDRGECLRRLAADEIGRLAVIDGVTPLIFPVNYVLDGDTIVFRTNPGTKLDHGPRAQACFEVDHFDHADHTGWSVVAVGRLEEVTRYDPAAFERVRALPIDPWASGDKTHWMRVVPDRFTGREVRAPA
ncbi:MAG TPA: pyridoxamine 5'-phosphate oxidase family protein [Acidimicrobiales bacterium]|nr:pyridoxamine 5'-phosphate oxidase family protein [Acidimicrobiales bacterium]